VNPDLSLYSFLLGLGGAVVAFLANDYVKEFLTAHRYRKGLVGDLDLFVREARGAVRFMTRLCEELDTEAAGEPRPAFLWAASVDLHRELHVRSHYLRSDEYRACQAAYQALARVGQIVAVYNQALRDAVIVPEQREGGMRVAKVCRELLIVEYGRVEDFGSRALLLFARGRPFLFLDESKYRRNELPTAGAGVRAP
jgi:hypothetical protein